MRKRPLLRRLLDSRPVMGAAIVLVLLREAMRIKLGEWRRSRVRKSEGVREEAEG